MSDYIITPDKLIIESNSEFSFASVERKALSEFFARIVIPDLYKKIYVDHMKTTALIDPLNYKPIDYAIDLLRTPLTKKIADPIAIALQLLLPVNFKRVLLQKDVNVLLSGLKFKIIKEE